MRDIEEDEDEHEDIEDDKERRIRASMRGDARGCAGQRDARVTRVATDAAAAVAE